MKPAATGVCWFLLGFCLSPVPSVPAQIPDDAPSALLQRVLSLKTTRSGSRPFAVIGTNVAENLAVVNWAEQTASQFEGVTGLSVPPSASLEIRISLRPASTGAVPAGVVGRTGVWTEAGTGRFLVGMVILGSEQADREQADAELCAALLTCLAAMRPAAVAGARGLPAVPSWLSVGLSQNLRADRKARNSEALGERLLEGRLPAIPALLAEGPAPDPAASGSLVSWILSLPGRTGLLESILDRAVEGRAVTPEWFAASLVACESVSDLDGKWDEWVLRQKRMVYEPGVARPEFFRRLRWELAVFPGDPGVPLSTNLSERISFRRLLERKEESWVSQAARSKAMSLRLLAVGRGPEANRVVDRFAVFLERLGAGSNAPDLAVLLENAERDVARLPAPAGVPSPSGPPASP